MASLNLQLWSYAQGPDCGLAPQLPIHHVGTYDTNHAQNFFKVWRILQ